MTKHIIREVIHLSDNEKLAKKAFNSNREKYLQALNMKSKLHAVKSLKEDTGFGLKEAKEIIDKFWSNNLMIPNSIEERKEKLEKLAKLPLINSLIVKIKESTDDDLVKVLNGLDIDDLLSIDDFLEEIRND